MSIENKFARIMRNSGPGRFLVPAGIILIIFGVILSGFNFDRYLQTTGKVTSVEEHVSTTDNKQKEYDISFTYTVDGKEYEGIFANLSKEAKVGDDIEVWYDPADPERLTNSKMSNLVAPAMIGVGAIAIIAGVLLTVKAFKKSKELDELTPGKGAPAVDFEAFKNAPGVTEIYCRFDGNSLKPGYILEDADRNVLFEGKMLKQNLVGARPFEFVDHENGRVTQHEVGHVMTQTYNNEFFSIKSWFKYDGKNIWDVLHGRGLRMTTDLHSKFPYFIYNVSKNGEAFARIESTSMYVHEDEEAEHKLVVPVGRYYYRIWTDSNDYETIFLSVFGISESEQTVVE